MPLATGPPVALNRRLTLTVRPFAQPADAAPPEGQAGPRRPAVLFVVFCKLQFSKGSRSKFNMLHVSVVGRISAAQIQLNQLDNQMNNNPKLPPQKASSVSPSEAANSGLNVLPPWLCSVCRQIRFNSHILRDFRQFRPRRSRPLSVRMG